ncbi:MAG: peptidylprolyl isomerase [Bacteroidetes bacterium]|nr:peptidylprolyl isomerase [Bacteroidota bacterium]
MNYKNLFSSFSLFVVLIVAFSSFNRVKAQNSNSTKVLIETNLGNIKVLLYNETPLHRDNFLKLVQQHYYDSLLFHRCIQNFMIQGGDPDSKYAPSDYLLGEGGPNYTVPAEFNSSLYHKKGALAAARDSDLDSPSQASSASQFYIVQGRVFTDSLLRTNQAKRITKMRLFNEIINRPEHKTYLEKYKAFAKAKNNDSIKVIYDYFNQKVDKEFETAVLYKFTEEQIKTYSTIGGTPHLDLSYSVFGEVIEGLDIIDKIAAQKTDSNNRPLNEVRIIKMSIIP